jgi:hypothetical protein
VGSAFIFLEKKPLKDFYLLGQPAEFPTLGVAHAGK